MSEWSKHVHRFAKKHNMSYKQANSNRKCKEAYKKRKTSSRRMNLVKRPEKKLRRVERKQDTFENRIRNFVSRETPSEEDELIFKDVSLGVLSKKDSITPPEN